MGFFSSRKEDRKTSAGVAGKEEKSVVQALRSRFVSFITSFACCRGEPHYSSCVADPSISSPAKRGKNGKVHLFHTGMQHLPPAQCRPFLRLATTSKPTEFLSRPPSSIAIFRIACPLRSPWLNRVCQMIRVKNLQRFEQVDLPSPLRWPSILMPAIHPSFLVEASMLSRKFGKSVPWIGPPTSFVG